MPHHVPATVHSLQSNKNQRCETEKYHHHPSLELLGCCVVGFLGSWILELLGCFVSGLLGCWVVWLSVGCWVVGLLGCWVVGLVGCWVVGLLGWWNGGLLNWIVGSLMCWFVESRIHVQKTPPDHKVPEVI